MGRPSYPKDVWEFRERFNSERKCLDYLIACRWPEGLRCPNCSSNQMALLASRNVFQCKKCRKQTYPLAQTVMHRSHLPLRKWFEAAYWVANHTPGMSALQLQKHISIGSYDTAWHLLHRLRKGMVNEARTKLTGLIEVDETFIGGSEKGKRGRGIASSENVSLVIGAVEVLVYHDEDGKRKERPGRIRLEVIPDASGETLGDFLERIAASGSRIRTDGWLGYTEEALSDFIHHVRVIKEPQRAHKRLPHTHRAFGNLKTWLNGTHHGVMPKHLPGYLNEYVFRYNRRETPMAALQTLLGISLSRSPLPMAELTSDVSTR